VTLTAMCLCFLTRTGADGRREVLLGRKKTGFGAGKIVGLGGHVEPGESAAEAAAREIAEESSLVVSVADLRDAADVTFRFPARPAWNMKVAVFVADRFTGEARESDEIAPRWYPLDALPEHDMWDDNRYWLTRVLAGERLEADFEFADDGETVADATIELAIELAAEEIEPGPR
jgi:8-oxo-dGTP diphosphatase